MNDRFFRIDGNFKVCSLSPVQLIRPGVEPWQVYTTFAVICVVACGTIYVVGREIWFAIHPDKRRVKKRKPVKE